MSNLKNTNISGEAISDIFDLIPETKTLKNIFTECSFKKFCETKLSKIAYKLRNSPYMPYTTGEDRLNLNRDFPTALCRWLSQFPEEVRFGFFLIALSIVYITEKEMDTFLEIAIEKLYQNIKETQGGAPIKHKIIPFPLSDTGIYDKFIHKMGIEGTLDRDKRPFRSQLGEFLNDTFLNLRQIAESGEDFIYFDMCFTPIRKLISSFLNSYIILVEDYAFSGRTIKSDIQKLLDLIKIIFEPFRNNIEKQGYKLPQFFLLIPLATDTALKEINNTLFSGDSIAQRYFYSPITGYVFDYTYRAITDIPQNIWELKSLFHKIKLFTHLKDSLQFFHANYAINYWMKETGIMSRSPFSIDDYVFGYAKGAWPIVTWRNSPNNSLPPIWYPHQGSSIKIQPLFRRVESRISHESSPELMEHMEIALADKKKIFGRGSQEIL